MGEERRAWSLRIDEARTIDELVALDRHLQGLSAGWAGALRMKVGARTAAMRRQVAAPSPTAFAAAYGLPAPDGRWLYRYRLADEAFARLQQDLRSKGGYERLGAGYGPALFVLWASEWFRRRYRGGGQRWRELAGALGIREDQAALWELTRKGLKLWGRSVIQASGSSRYLSSLAREGGFPAAAVEEGGKGWARDVLESIVAPLLGEPAAQEERAHELAMMQRQRLPQVFQDEEFVQLCADLALAVVRLRRDAEAQAIAAGLPLAAWLGLHRPGWRDALPLTAGDAVADALIEGLMKVEAITGAAVHVDRLLSRDQTGNWVEAVRIGLDGAVDNATMRGIDPIEGRLRAFATGGMSRHLPGELALFEPPADGETFWVARPSRQVRGIRALPFAAAIELELRAGERRVAQIQLAGGKPRRGQLLVAVLDQGTEEAPQALRIVGSGSGHYRADMVFLHLPEDWQVHATAGEQVESLGRSVGATLLWRVHGGAFVTDSSGDRYRILCGQSEERVSRIDLIGKSVDWAEISGNIDIFSGPPLATFSGQQGALFMRAIGTRTWRPAPNKLPPGHYELGLRQDNILLDRRQIAVLPADARVTASGSGQGTSYDVQGFAGVAIRPDDNTPVVANEKGDGWRARPVVAPVYRFGAQIEWLDAPPLDVSIAFPSEAAIARWDGRTLPANTRVTLNELRDLVAVDRGRMELLATLKDATSGQRAEMAWQFDRELPMNAVAADIASMLLPASIDATVLLDMHNGINTNWYVRQFPLELKREGPGFVASEAIIAEDVALCGRSFADPAKEVRFGAYSLLTEANHRPAALPPELAGTWLVYLRSGEQVLTRPTYVQGHGHVTPLSSLLGQAMLSPPGPMLDQALAQLLRQAGGEGDDADATIAELAALTASLNGLPPATFRVLALLPEWPDTLARMALASSGAAREAVLTLSDALPFAWYALPLPSWNRARGIALVQNMALLESLGDKARGYAKEMVDMASAVLIEREPLLSPVLGKSEQADAIADIVQRFVNRGAIDRIRGSSFGRYREHLGERLPAYFQRFAAHCLDTFDAPCAAALAVRGEWRPDVDAIRHIKGAARTFPTYFSEAFAASLKEYC